MTGALMRPLSGIRVVEFEGIGPGPLAAMMLADLGAEVTTLVRPGPTVAMDQLSGGAANPLRRGKRIEVIDVKTAEGRERTLELISLSHALIEGNRPGVMERLGLGPSDCAERNPSLVYGRMTGWGQNGPLAKAAGHDLNYIALTGLLGLNRPGAKPVDVPPTVLGDAGGALGLAFGIASALLAVRCGAPGCVVDAAIVDVVAMLGSIAQWIRSGGQLGGPELSPFHDSPFYNTYECSDGGFITLAPIEPQFYKVLLHQLHLDDLDAEAQYDKSAWPVTKARVANVIKSQTRTHWCDLLEGSDVCFAPVLSPEEAACHAHNRQRGTYNVDDSGSIAAAPAPRFLPLRS